MLNNYLKRIFCEHAYPILEFSTKCKNKVICSKCGKGKIVYYHDYKELTSEIVTESLSSPVSGFVLTTKCLKQALRCYRCGKYETIKYYL